MRKADEIVQEVTCSETGKPMPKIPLWMAGIKVKFISDEARQKHPPSSGFADIEAPVRRTSSAAGLDDLKGLDVVDAVVDADADDDFDEVEAEVEPEEASDDIDI